MALPPGLYRLQLVKENPIIPKQIPERQAIVPERFCGLGIRDMEPPLEPMKGKAEERPERQMYSRS